MESTSPLRLHLGCGGNKREGWVNLDSVAEFQPDIVHDISQPLPFADMTADEVLAEDLLEHFDKYMRFLVFYQWIRVLKTGGTITLQVPNFKKTLLKYFKFGFDNFVDFIFGENMLFSEVYIGHFGNHKWGYSVKTLQGFVKLFGLEPVSVETKGLNIRLTAEKKRHLLPEDIENIQIYSHANACGNGKASLPLKFVKEKIRIFQEGERERDGSL